MTSPFCFTPQRRANLWYVKEFDWAVQCRLESRGDVGARVELPHSESPGRVSKLGQRFATFQFHYWR